MLYNTLYHRRHHHRHHQHHYQHHQQSDAYLFIIMFGSNCALGPDLVLLGLNTDHDSMIFSVRANPLSNLIQRICSPAPNNFGIARIRISVLGWISRTPFLSLEFEEFGDFLFAKFCPWNLLNASSKKAWVLCKEHWIGHGIPWRKMYQLSLVKGYCLFWIITTLI